MITVMISCDNCGKVGEVLTGPRRSHATHVRQKVMRKEGWTYIQTGGQDYCPNCSFLRAAQERIQREAEAARGESSRDRDRRSKRLIREVDDIAKSLRRIQQELKRH